MKIKVAVVFLALLSLSFSRPPGEPHPSIYDRSIDEYRGMVKEVWITTYDGLFKNNKIVKGSLRSKTHEIYDNNGREIYSKTTFAHYPKDDIHRIKWEVKNTPQGKIITRFSKKYTTVYKNNNRGMTVERQFIMNNNGLMFSKTQYIYKNSLLWKKIDYSLSGRLDTLSIYTYNILQQISECKKFSYIHNNGKVAGTKHFATHKYYYENNRLVRIDKYHTSKKGKKYKRYDEYKYINNGVQFNAYFSNKKIHHGYFKRTDKRGNVVFKIEYYSDGSIQISDYSYRYR